MEIATILRKHKYHYKTKSFRMMFFIYKLVCEKNITDLEVIRNYCHLFYNTDRTTIYKSINFLIKNEFVKVKRTLGDARKKNIFPIT